MSWRDLIPRLGWEPLTAYDVIDLGLDPGSRWEALHFSWFGRGFMFMARPR